MMKNFATRAGVGFLLWMFYTMEFALILVFLDEWLNLSWVSFSPTPLNFFDGIMFLLLFIVSTLLTGLAIVVCTTENIQDTKGSVDDE